MTIDDLQVAQLANGGIGSVRLELALRQCGADVMLLSEPAQVLQHLQSDACSVGAVQESAAAANGTLKSRHHTITNWWTSGS